MSLSQYDPITQAVVDALATLAASKVSGFPDNTYLFNPFRGTDAIGLPPKITPKATYGIGIFTDGFNVRMWLFPYKTISSKKTYAYSPVTSDFTGISGSGTFSLTWIWVSPVGATAPDGYIAIVVNDGVFVWKDIGAIQTLTEPGTFFGWTTDSDLQDNHDNNTPCANGIWLKLMNRIRQAVCFSTDIECLNSGDVTGLEGSSGGIGDYNGIITPLGIAGLVSGPWCVGVCGGTDANTLQSWVDRTSIFISPGIGVRGFGPGYTQCYRTIKFYFRSQDGPSVNITAQNQLIDYIIGSDPVTTTTAHYHLRIVSCSDGHIKVQDTGGGTIRTDMDVTAGTQYDISFDVTGASITGLPFPKSLDFFFTTPAATGLGVSDVGIELTNDVRSIDVPDSYCEIEFNNLVTDIGLGGVTTIQLCTSCLQLTLTENNSVQGVWVANTIPTMGPMPYLDQDLPQYKPSVAFPADTRRVPLNSALPYIAAVNNRGALWPVFRDTDFTPDSVGGLPLLGSKAWQTSIFSKYIISNTFIDSVPPTPISGLLFSESVFVGAVTADVRFYTNNPDCTLYIRANSPPTTSLFDAVAPGGSWIDLATAVPGFATDTQWFYGFLNPTSGNITVSSTTVLIQDAAAPNGTFFPTEKDDLDVVIPKIEGFSYFFDDPNVRFKNYPIPLLGYCVYSVTVRRMPIDNGSGVFLSPSNGTSALNVKLGLMSGFGWATAGTFTDLQAVIIPAGQSEIVTTVFWPVLSGAPLVYQCTESVKVVSEVNFQPMMHSKFQSVLVPFGGGSAEVGYWNGSAWFDPNKAMLCFQHGFTTDPVILPISASVLNDLMAVLNLLP